MSPRTTVTFIVPCFNEARRLPEVLGRWRRFFTEHPTGYGLSMVDDGSTDETRRLLEAFTEAMASAFPSSPFKTISYAHNKGKGWAIKQGVDACDTRWCLTLDADLSSGPEELIAWLERGLLDLDGVAVYIGCREQGIRRGWVKTSFFRRLIGRTFNRIVRGISGIPFMDTQCGFKLYPTDVARYGFEDLTDYGFAHDVEVLMRIRARHVAVTALPVHWLEQGRSKVRVARDGAHMLRTVFSVARKDVG